MRMKIKGTDREVCRQLKIAENFLERLMGLMFLRDMIQVDGLLIKGCKSIHTCFMRFSIDIAFLDKELKVIKVLKSVRPWRMTRLYWRADQVLEMKAGLMPDFIEKGVNLEICLS